MVAYLDHQNDLVDSFHNRNLIDTYLNQLRKDLVYMQRVVEGPIATQILNKLRLVFVDMKFSTREPPSHKPVPIAITGSSGFPIAVDGF